MGKEINLDEKSLKELTEEELEELEEKGFIKRKGDKIEIVNEIRTKWDIGTFEFTRKD